MVWVGLAVVLGDVYQWPEPPRVRCRPDRHPKRLGTEVIQDDALAPPLRSAGLHVTMVPGLDGVMDVMVIANLVVHGRAPRGRIAPSLLSRLGAPGPWMAEATARGVTTASAHW